MPEPAVIALEDGALFRGEALAGGGSVGGELMFTTAMTGYQQVVTDPACHGRLVAFTVPMVGNYGVHPEADESDRVHAQAVICREITNYGFDRAAAGTWLEWLSARRILAVRGVDTRALARHLRRNGPLRAVVTTERAEERTLRKAARSLPRTAGVDLVKAVTCQAAVEHAAQASVGAAPKAAGAPPAETGAAHIVAYDFGIKRSLIRRLLAEGFRVTVVPASTPARQARSLSPDGVVLSGGPGDPAAVAYAVEIAGRLLGKVPILAVGLGHQVLALALGLETARLACGHHGLSHPVLDQADGRVLITAQHHDYAVSAPQALPDGVEITHVSLADGTIEGLRHQDAQALSVQFDPSAPGTGAEGLVFTQFRELVEAAHAARVPGGAGVSGASAAGGGEE